MTHRTTVKYSNIQCALAFRDVPDYRVQFFTEYRVLRRFFTGYRVPGI